MAAPKGKGLMTHHELLAKLLISNETKLYETLTQWQKVLYAVVELHKPSGGWFCDACAKPNDEVIYPCPTIQAIEKELK